MLVNKLTRPQLPLQPLHGRRQTGHVLGDLNDGDTRIHQLGAQHPGEVRVNAQGVEPVPPGAVKDGRLDVLIVHHVALTEPEILRPFPVLIGHMIPVFRLRDAHTGPPRPEEGHGQR